MFRKKNDKPSHSWTNFRRNPYTPEKMARAEQLLDEANTLGALTDACIVSLFQALRANPGDMRVQNLIEDALGPYRLQNILEPDFLRPYPGPESGLDIGDIEVGVIKETGISWRLQVFCFPFIVVVGPTGSGKTSLVYAILEAIS